jgi:ectoine hydroxylase-related dioxygenase (phytanoyl-CoA dioxygenase family)
MFSLDLWIAALVMYLAVSLDQDGFEIKSGVLGGGEVDGLVAAVEKVARGSDVTGIRQPHISMAEVAEVIDSRGIRGVVESIVGDEARVVRSILFDKTAEKNWGVPWHQDLTIAALERRDVEGFVGWSVKDGVNHVQAPREVLEKMLTMRLHLDDCGLENGPLRVLPGTHRYGWLDSETIEKMKREVNEQACVVKRGGAVLMRPLLLHASSRATQPAHRRVLHLEFAAGELPGGLKFFGEV